MTSTTDIIYLPLMAMAAGHGCWPWPLAMGIRAILAIRASGQSNSAIRAILAIRAIQASGHPGIRKPPGAPMSYRGTDPIDRPVYSGNATSAISQSFCAAHVSNEGKSTEASFCIKALKFGSPYCSHGSFARLRSKRKVSPECRSLGEIVINTPVP